MKLFINDVPLTLFSFLRLVGLLVRVVWLKSFLFSSFGFWWCLLVVGINVLYTVGRSSGGPY